MRESGTNRMGRHTASGCVGAGGTRFAETANDERPFSSSLAFRVLSIAVVLSVAALQALAIVKPVALGLFAMAFVTGACELVRFLALPATAGLILAIVSVKRLMERPTIAGSLQGRQ